MTHDPNVKIIENATRDDGQPGDCFDSEWTTELNGVAITIRRKGIAHHRDKWGDWETAEGGLLTEGEGTGVTITIRRTVTSEESAL